MTMVTVEKILLALLTLSWSGWALSYAVGRWTHGREGSEQLFLRDIADLTKRMDKAGNAMSDLASKLQGFEARMYDVFVPLKTVGTMMDQANYEHQAIRESARGSHESLSQRIDDVKRDHETLAAFVYRGRKNPR